MIGVVAVNDISMIVRQVRNKYDHMVDIWVDLENLQIVRSRHETAGVEATANAEEVILAGEDPILTRQNQMNLVAGRNTAAIFMSTPEAIAAIRNKTIECEGILMGLGDALYRDRK